MLWTFHERGSTVTSAVLWGAALLVIMLWGTYSFSDSHIGMELPPESYSIVRLIVWVVCAGLVLGNLIIAARGDGPSSATPS